MTDDIDICIFLHSHPFIFGTRCRSAACPKTDMDGLAPCGCGYKFYSINKLNPPCLGVQNTSMSQGSASQPYILGQDIFNLFYNQENMAN
jgi:hypothetical protein